MILFPNIYHLHTQDGVISLLETLFIYNDKFNLTIGFL